MRTLARFVSITMAVLFLACGTVAEEQQLREETQAASAASATVPQSDAPLVDQSLPSDGAEPLAYCAGQRNDGCTYIYNQPKTNSCGGSCIGMCPNPVDPKCAGKKCYCMKGGGGL